MKWTRVVLLVAACSFLAGSVVYYLENRSASASSVDAGFYRDMVLHHEQAIEMSLLELANGTDPTVRGFAQEIVIFQQYEIGRMDEQLLRWSVGRREPDDTAMAWMDAPVVASQMPGLATEAQMDALRDAAGSDADALFLDLMAEHHRGGAHMASYAAEHASDDGVRALAARMARNQVIEISEFAQTVDRLGLDIVIEPYVSPGGAEDHGEHGG